MVRHAPVVDLRNDKERRAIMREQVLHVRNSGYR